MDRGICWWHLASSIMYVCTPYILEMEVVEAHSLLTSKRRLGMTVGEVVEVDAVEGAVVDDVMVALLMGGVTVMMGAGTVLVATEEGEAVEAELKIESWILASLVGDKLAKAAIMVLVFKVLVLGVNGRVTGCIAGSGGAEEDDGGTLLLVVLGLIKLTGGMRGSGMRGSSISTLGLPLL